MRQMSTPTTFEYLNKELLQLDFFFVYIISKKSMSPIKHTTIFRFYLPRDIADILDIPRDLDEALAFGGTNPPGSDLNDFIDSYFVHIFLYMNKYIVSHTRWL